MQVEMKRMKSDAGGMKIEVGGIGWADGMAEGFCWFRQWGTEDDDAGEDEEDALALEL